MKYARKSISILIVLMLSSILVTTAFAAYPIPDVTMYVVDGTDSYFLITLSGIPAGEDIYDGDYLGWCIDRNHLMPREDSLTVVLYSSLDPPGSLLGKEWDKVNYLLNNKDSYSVDDIQHAIWHYTGWWNYENLSPSVQAIVDEVDANGDGYIPGPCDVLAVICLPEEQAEAQMAIVELGQRCPGFTPGFWKHNIRVALGYPGRFSSFDDSGDHLTYEEVLGYVEATGLWGTGTSALEAALADLTAKGPGSDMIRRDAANALNHVAGFGDFMD